MMDVKNYMIKITGLKKKYKLGVIGGRTLAAELQSWWARLRKKEDPNAKIGANTDNYGQEFFALKGIDLEVMRGERVGIIGRNGSGKSTLLKLLSRITAPTEGEIRIRGRISSMLEVGTGFNGEMTGRENIYLNGAILGMTKLEIDSKIDDIIAFSECGQFIDTPVKRYSSGMYVKLAFAVAAHLDADILVMDEVLAVGDLAFQQKCLKTMNTLSKENQRTILYVSHNMNTVRQLCSRCIVLNEGRVIYDGEVEKAINVYASQYETIENDVDLTAVKREKWLGEDQVVKMEQLSLADREKACYEQGEKVRCQLTWRATNSLDNVEVKVVLKTRDALSIGVAMSNERIAIKPGGREMIELVVDTSFLSEGEYICDIQLVEMTSTLAKTVDSVSDIFSFEIVEKKNANGILDYQRFRFGNIVFPEIAVHVIKEGNRYPSER